MEAANGKILRVLRKRKGYLQTMLAERLGKSQSYISRVELGKKNLAEKEMAHFLAVLETSHQSYESLLKTEIFLEEAATYKSSISTRKDQNSFQEKSKEELLKIVKKYFLNQPVKSAYVFGSVARNEHTPESDLDILVAFKESYKATLFDLIGFKQDLMQLTGYEVDIVQEGTAYPHVQKELEKEKIAVYG